ncbi:MAG TPA: hypothetical protein VHG91_11880 [Longimicrobium sp.]|nr:hypothetical protein [Longimicrobium sp.]
MKKPILFAAALAAAALCARPSAAQVFARPHLEWRTVRTEHFEVHYPAELSEWTLDVATRLEAVHAEVAALVGYAPPRRTTIVVEDPSSQTNGFAYPFLDQPAIALWPTPPDPRSNLGNNRGPSEQLVVHEFAHVAHLSRPSRNPRQRLLWSLLPVRVGPVARKAPRWVIEGYATYVEGKLTGSGRPHSAIRAAVLRQWALEGRLPTYAQLSSSGGYYGGAFAYLAGSAFLEWLASQRGEESLTHLWRRMSARQDRAFADAFAGVYGGAPHELYGRFVVEVTASALEARRQLAAAGLVEGDTVQRLYWGTGDPAVSRDGRQMAVVIRGAPGTPSRVAVWSTADEPDTLSAKEAARLLRADPEDVPDVRWRPRPKRPLATLYPVNGRGHDQPRFLPDGRLLVVRSEPLGDGALRPDLFVWDWKRKEMTRVTRGASIRWADPAPDGRTAAAVRCLHGSCDLVRVDLVTGAVATLADAPPERVLYRPRYAPDGSSIALAVQEGGRWRLALADPSSGSLRYLGPDDGASRYDAAWLPDGRGLLHVSEAGGVANVATLDLATGETRPLTRVTGAAVAPEPVPGAGHVFFLALHAGGLDLRRVHPDSARPGTTIALSPTLAPAAPRAAASVPDTLPRAAVEGPFAYGLGPRRTRLLPGGAASADGASATLLAVNGDPVGRLTASLRGTLGQRGLPRGASATLAWRGFLPAVAGEAFWMEHDPSRRSPALAGDSLDAGYRGAALHAETPWAGSALRRRARAGASLGELSLDEGGSDRRALAFAEYEATLARAAAGRSFSAAVALHGAVGETRGEEWRRGIARGALRVSTGPLGVRGEATYGWVSGGAPAWERFVVGGAPQGLFDDALVSQRLAMPAARFGVVQGRELVAYRVSTALANLTPYLWGASADEGHDSWYRVAGVETAFDFGGFNILRIPGARLLAGVGYPLDPPNEKNLEAYFTITYRP